MAYSCDEVVDDEKEATQNDDRNNPTTAVSSFSVSSMSRNGQPTHGTWWARLLGYMWNDFHEPWSQDENVIRNHDAFKDLGKVLTLWKYIFIAMSLFFLFAKGAYTQTVSVELVSSVPVSVLELDDLRRKYGSVECKCKSTSVPYKDFAEVSLTVNEICSYIPSELIKSKALGADASSSICAVMNGHFAKLCVQVDEDCNRAASFRSRIVKKFESKRSLSSVMLSEGKLEEAANATFTDYFDETKLFLTSPRYEVDRWAKESMPKVIGIIGAVADRVKGMNARDGWIQNIDIMQACIAKGCVMETIANGVCNRACHSPECFNDGGKCERAEIDALKTKFPQYRATINQSGFASDGSDEGRSSWLSLPASSNYYIGSTNFCDYDGWSEPGHQEYQDLWKVFRPGEGYYQQFVDAGASLTRPPTTYCRLPLAMLTGTCDRSTTAINPRTDWFAKDGEDSCKMAFAEWIKWLEVNGQAIDSAGTIVQNSFSICLFGICKFPELGSQWLSFTEIIQDYVLEVMAPAQRTKGNYENAVKNVFVETATTQVDYKKYFAACSVTNCTYFKKVGFSLRRLLQDIYVSIAGVREAWHIIFKPVYLCCRNAILHDIKTLIAVVAVFSGVNLYNKSPETRYYMQQRDDL